MAELQHVCLNNDAVSKVDAALQLCLHGVQMDNATAPLRVAPASQGPTASVASAAALPEAGSGRRMRPGLKDGRQLQGAVAAAAVGAAGSRFSSRRWRDLSHGADRLAAPKAPRCCYCRRRRLGRHALPAAGRLHMHTARYRTQPRGSLPPTLCRVGTGVGGGMRRVKNKSLMAVQRLLGLPVSRSDPWRMFVYC